MWVLCPAEQWKAACFCISEWVEESQYSKLLGMGKSEGFRKHQQGLGTPCQAGPPPPHSSHCGTFGVSRHRWHLGRLVVEAAILGLTVGSLQTLWAPNPSTLPQPSKEERRLWGKG